MSLKPYDVTYPDKQYILCIEYLNQDDKKVIAKSAPTTHKAAHRKRREYIALRKGLRCWVEKDKSFKLVSQ